MCIKRLKTGNILSRFRFYKTAALLCLLTLLTVSGVFAGEIVPEGTYSYGENVGWFNWKPTHSSVTVYDTYLSGYLWQENVGWIHVGDGPAEGENSYSNDPEDEEDYGVNRNPETGELSGYGWSENAGWINFAPTHGGIYITSDGKFYGEDESDYGWAWGQNIGWINFLATDLPPPEIEIITQPDEYEDNEGNSIDFQVKVTDENHSDVQLSLKYYWSGEYHAGTLLSDDFIEGSRVATGTVVTCTWDILSDGLMAESTATIKIIAFDVPGSTGTMVTNIFNFDSLAPRNVEPSFPEPYALNISTNVTLYSTLGKDATNVYYLFEIAEDDDFTVSLQDSGWIEKNEWKPGEGLQNSTEYWWRVKAKDAWGNTSGYIVEYSSFVTVAPLVTEQPQFMRNDGVLGPKRTDDPLVSSIESGEGSGNEDLVVDWSIQVWAGGENLTDGEYEAIVTRTSNGESLLDETWTCSEIELDPADTIEIRIYARLDEGSWEEQAYFETESLGAVKLNESEWRIYYYTEYDTGQTNGGSTRYTNGYFHWGSENYDSRIEGISYSFPDANNPPTPPTDISIIPTLMPSTTDHITCSVWGSSDPDDGDTVTYYYQWYRDGEAFGTAVSSATNMQKPGDTKFSVVLDSEDTSPGEEWYVIAWAEDEHGYASTGTITSSVFTIQEEEDPHPAPYNISKVSVYKSSITVSWECDGVPENGFVLEASTDSFISVSASSETLASPATVTGLDANTTYYMRVGAQYEEETSWSAEDPPYPSTATLAVPVTDAEIYAVFSSSVTLNWAAHPPEPSSATCSGYIVQVSTDSGFSVIAGSSITYSRDVSTLTVTGLEGGTTYYFQVGAYNWNLVPNYVTVGSTRTLDDRPAAVTNLTAEAEYSGDLTLNWTWPEDITDGLYRIRWSTNSEVDWMYDFDVDEEGFWGERDDRYSIKFETDTVKGEQHSYTVADLNGGVTYYFALWTSYPDNSNGWSDISNIASTEVYRVISISLSTDTYNFGEVDAASSAVSQSSITVTNKGNVTQKYSKYISSVVLFNNNPSAWVSTNTVAGHDRFLLSSIFHKVNVSTDNFTPEDDALLFGYENRSAADNSIFTDPDGGDNKQLGYDVAKGDDRYMWLRIDMPTTLSTAAQQKITITINARECEGVD